MTLCVCWFCLQVIQITASKLLDSSNWADIGDYVNYRVGSIAAFMEKHSNKELYFSLEFQSSVLLGMISMLDLVYSLNFCLGRIEKHVMLGLVTDVEKPCLPCYISAALYNFCCCLPFLYILVRNFELVIKYKTLGMNTSLYITTFKQWIPVGAFNHFTKVCEALWAWYKTGGQICFKTQTKDCNISTGFGNL